jgi:hypothetical protein
MERAIISRPYSLIRYYCGYSYTIFLQHPRGLQGHRKGSVCGDQSDTIAFRGAPIHVLKGPDDASRAALLSIQRFAGDRTVW